METKNYVLWLGIVLVAVGIVGFFNNPILGLFAVNTLHNSIHIVTGALAIGFALASEKAAQSYAKTFGVLYGLVTIGGAFSSGGMVLGIAINGADNALHLLLTLAFLTLGFMPYLKGLTSGGTMKMRFLHR